MEAINVTWKAFCSRCRKETKNLIMEYSFKLKSSQNLSFTRLQQVHNILQFKAYNMRFNIFYLSLSHSLAENLPD